MTELSSATEAGVEPAEDLLSEIDRLMQKRLEDEQHSADKSARLNADRVAFETEFTRICELEVRAPMEAVIERLRRNGGSGVIEEHVKDPRHQARGLTLWMSLGGEIAGTPREDRHPYLRLDADVDKRSVAVSEGDMWQGHGGNRTGRVGNWQLSQVTTSRVIQEILAILRRSSA